MANKLITKKSTVAGKAPLASDLDIGELAVNTADAKLYTKHSDGTVKQLSAGPPGSTGPAGPINGLRYTFTATNTADTAPDVGAFKYNSTTFASIIWIYLNILDADLNLQSDAIAGWDDVVGSTSRGILSLQSNSGSKPSAIFRITGVIQPGNGYVKIPVQPVSGSVFADGTSVSINFAPTGAKGDAGTNGLNGTAASISVGTVTTGAPGSAATVTNAGTPSSAILNFGIPQGQQGPAGTVAVGTVTTGAPGSSASVNNSGTSAAAVLDFTIPKGDTGTAATVAVGTVTTGAAGSSAAVSNSGTGSAAVLDFTIPKGDPGDPGPSGVATATAPLTYDSATQTLSTSMSTNRLLGRFSAGTGVAQQISIGTNLTLSGGTLSAPAFSTWADVNGATTTTGTGTNGTTTLTVASGSGIANGDYLAGPGIIGGTKVASGGGTTTLTTDLNLSGTTTNAPIVAYDPTSILNPGIIGPGVAKAGFMVMYGPGTVNSSPFGTCTATRIAAQTLVTITTQRPHNLLSGHWVYCTTGAISGITATFYKVTATPSPTTFQFNTGASTAVSAQAITFSTLNLSRAFNIHSIPGNTSNTSNLINFATDLGTNYIPMVTAITGGNGAPTPFFTAATSYLTNVSMSFTWYNQASGVVTPYGMTGVFF